MVNSKNMSDETKKFTNRELLFCLVVHRVFDHACIKVEIHKYQPATATVSLVSKFFKRMTDNDIEFYVDTEDINKCKNTHQMYQLLMKHCLAEMMCDGFRDGYVFTEEVWNDYQIG